MWWERLRRAEQAGSEKLLHLQLLDQGTGGAQGEWGRWVRVQRETREELRVQPPFLDPNTGWVYRSAGLR